MNNSVASSPSVDMSPAAIMARLRLVGELNDLCRFLQTGERLQRNADSSPRLTSVATSPDITDDSRPIDAC